MKNSIAHRICAVLAAAFIPAPDAAAADFYKCKDSAGRVSYQDQPCATGSGETLDIRPLTPTRRSDISTDRVSDSERAARRDIEAARRMDEDRDADRRSADWTRRMDQIDREADDRAARWRRALSQ